ncbi:MAG: hypothetical protein HUK02_06220 [Bacteroidaceae bacterium]|nr:hypothetical protein [Bacteroidaceae bacterium]
MILKSFCCAAVAFALSLSAGAQEVLIVSTRTSEPVAYALQTRPTVTFTATEMVFTAQDVVVTYPLADKVEFTFGTLDAVDRVEGLSAVVTCAEGRVEVSRVEAGTVVSLLDVSGRLLQQTTADSAGRATLTSAGKGVFVVQMESRSTAARQQQRRAVKLRVL